MNDVLLDYRDDGPVALLARRLDLAAHAPSAPLTLLGAALLALALAFDAGRSGLVALAGVTTFVLLASLGWRPGWRLGWLVPPVLRLTEYGCVAVLAATTGGSAPAGAYGYLAALAFHHYDTIYRVRHQGSAPPPSVRLAGLGWDGRLLLTAVLAVAGVLTAGLVVLAVALGVLFVSESALSWRRSAGTRTTTMAGGGE